MKRWLSKLLRYHDNQYHDGKEYWVILDLIYLKHDELLIEEVQIHVVIENGVHLTPLMEGFQDSGKIIDGKSDTFFLHHLRDALTGKLIEGIKTQMSHL